MADPDALRKLLTGQDAVVSCLPYHLNLAVARIAYELGIHYFDLTEDVATTAAIRQIGPKHPKANGATMWIGPRFYRHRRRTASPVLYPYKRYGAKGRGLAKVSQWSHGYSFTWSPAGVINEYINDAEVIHNGVRKMVPSLEGLETINIEGQEFEAFSTQSGLGTLCETLEGKVDTLNYKTIRYPGHARLMRFLLYELILKEKESCSNRYSQRPNLP